MLVVVNPGISASRRSVAVDLTKVGIPGVSQVRDLEDASAPISLAGGRIHIEVPTQGFRLIALE